MRALLAFAALAAATPGCAQAACNAACLEGLAAQFVDGLAAGKAGAGVAWGEQVAYTENGVPIMVGDGIWASVTAHGEAKLVVADPLLHSVVWIGEIAEHGQPGWLALRLKEAGGRIVEAEAVMRRKEGHPPFAAPETSVFPVNRVPTKVRLSRARLIALDAASRRQPDARNGDQHAPPPGGTPRAMTVAAVDPARGIVVSVGRRDHWGAPGDADGAFPHSYALERVTTVIAGKVERIDEIDSDLLPYLMPDWKHRR